MNQCTCTHKLLFFDCTLRHSCPSAFANQSRLTPMHVHTQTPSWSAHSDTHVRVHYNPIKTGRVIASVFSLTHTHTVYDWRTLSHTRTHVFTHTHTHTHTHMQTKDQPKDTNDVALQKNHHYMHPHARVHSLSLSFTLSLSFSHAHTQTQTHENTRISQKMRKHRGHLRNFIVI